MPEPGPPSAPAPDPIHLTLWGPSAAGKTVLLAQIYIETAGGDGEWEIFPTAESHEFIRQMRGSMAANLVQECLGWGGA